jgi:hypothetical protein
VAGSTAAVVVVAVPGSGATGSAACFTTPSVGRDGTGTGAIPMPAQRRRP